MKNIIFNAITLFLITLQLHSQRHVAQQHTDKKGYRYETVTNDVTGMRVYTLKNGLKVYLGQNKLRPTAFYKVAVRNGSAYDPVDNTGMAHYLEHLLFNGTETVGALNWAKEKPLIDQLEVLYEKNRMEQDSNRRKAIYRDIDSISYEASKYGLKGEYKKLLSNIGVGIVNGVTFPEAVYYVNEVPALSLEKLLMLEHDRFTKPSFRSFATELEIVYEEYNGQQDNYFWHVYNAATKVLFPDHYYREIGLPNADQLKRPSLKTAREYFHKYYVPGNMAVVIVGDIDLDKTIQWVDKAFGTMKPGPLPTIMTASSAELKTPVVVNVTNPQPEVLWLCYKMRGAGSPDEKYFTLLHEMLNNKVGGLFTTELISPQKTGNVISHTGFPVLKDHIAQYIEARPTQGQTLEEVKDRLLALLDKIKKGDFEEWMMKVSARNVKSNYTKQITVDEDLDSEAVTMFTRYKTWAEQLNMIEDIQQITKNELVAFANRIYKDNYVVVYKRKGENPDLVRVAKPERRTLLAYDSIESDFAKQFKKIPLKSGKPVFVDYKKDIAFSKLANGMDMMTVPNKQPGNFELDVIYDMGKNHLPKLGLMANYLGNLGTTKYTSEQLKKEFFKLGLNFAIRPTDNSTVFHLDGEQQNMQQGIVLMNHFIDHLKADKITYDNHVKWILSNRKNLLANRNQLSNSLFHYTLYGEQSAFRNVLPEDTLMATQAEELTTMATGLKQYRFRVFYHGNEPAAAANAMNKHYLTGSTFKKPPVGRKFIARKTTPAVYFVHFPGTQAEVGLCGRSEKFSNEAFAVASFFGFFLGKVTFDEVREQRSLAYNSWGSFLPGADTSSYENVELYSTVQANKVIEALDVMQYVLKGINNKENLYEGTLINEKKAYENQRIYGRDLFNRYEQAKARGTGIDHDIRRDIYERLKTFDYNQMQQFFADHITGRDLAILIVGDRNIIDMKQLEKYGTVKELEPKYLLNY